MLGAASILLAIVVIYARSTTAYFFDDDFHWLVQTQSFTPGRIFDLSRYDHFYRPVIEYYFAIGLAVFGCNPFPYHVASVAIHVLTTAAVFALARSLARSSIAAYLAALFFAVQPGMTDAVTWIGAITDQLPVLWYVLAIVCHLEWVRRRTPAWFAAALTAFVLCHLTHESSATLLPMMVVTDGFFAASGTWAERVRAVLTRIRPYGMYAVLLLVYLAIEYIVNSRSYVVREGHYAFGPHAVANILNYVLWLYVGQRALIDYVATVCVLGAILVWGRDTMRYAIVWIVVTLLPVAFFTWPNAPRYLYLPAVGFSLLAAELMRAFYRVLASRAAPRTALVLVSVVVIFLTVRFAKFAKDAADSFPSRTAPYARFVEDLRRLNPNARAGEIVVIDAASLDNVPELYREPAARIGLCLPDLRLQIR